MNKIESKTEMCLSCNHLGFCQVYWGAECKRQGGNRIPRMKPMLVEARQKVDQPNKVIEMFEPIRTKVANW
ncbi:MAG: hypothetical protein PHZ03_04380 [Syntrophomonas sp.]|nr:hypothetical protein [Syntrophomonas sp.]